MLNYAYAILQSQLQIEAVAEGYDPTLGIMHNGYQSSSALVFDLMEPYRPKVDAAVLAFALSEPFVGADFVIRSDGVVRLALQLARRVCQLVCGQLRNSLYTLSDQFLRHEHQRQHRTPEQVI
jgi:CRISPR/Cas system-associated endonuclease Cas1